MGIGQIKWGVGVDGNVSSSGKSMFKSTEETGHDDGLERPELTSSHKHTKSTTMCRTTLDEKDQNLPEKIFYN